MERKEKHIDEGTLHAWLDGALGAEDSARVEAHVASCAACGAAAAEARGLVAAASRILTALDDVPGGVAPGMGGRGAGVRFSASVERRRRLWTGWPLRAAAAVIFVVAGSLAVVQRMGLERPSLAPATATTRVAEPLTAPASAPPPSVPPQSVKKQRPALQQKPAHKRQDAAADTTAPAPAPAAALDSAAQATAVSAAVAEAITTGDSIARARAVQPVTIAGRVVSAQTGEPVAAAQVHLSNPPVSSATNANGYYAIPVPSDKATGQPAKITVRRIGFESKVDSVTVAQAAPADTVRRDIALAPATTKLDAVVVAGTGERTAAKAAAPRPAAMPQAMSSNMVRRELGLPTAPGCYTIDVAGLPARIELGEHLRVMPPDSAAFPTAYWVPVGRTAVRIILTDTSGTTREIRGMIEGEGLRGYVRRLDSATVVKPFFASKTSAQCP
jgi:hypothetical protein